MEKLFYGLDTVFAYLDGDADRLRLFEIAAKMSRVRISPPQVLYVVSNRRRLSNAFLVY
jgi:hypothetical protein